MEAVNRKLENFFSFVDLFALKRHNLDSAKIYDILNKKISALM